jgi:hypothetical protein
VPGYIKQLVNFSIKYSGKNYYEVSKRKGGH